MFQRETFSLAEGFQKVWPYILGLFVMVVLLIAYRVSSRKMKSYLLKRAHKPEIVQNFLFIWRYVWWGLIVLFAVISFSGSLATLGISAAFLGMMLGWSLQAPVTGIAAWLMIILKRPFKLGDRVIISGIVGDVMDITLTHIVLNQVGGTIGGEERSGRGVLIPNAILFQQIIHNYTYESKYILDEVPVLITHESDLEEAERILLDAAHRVTSEIIQTTGHAPFVRAEFTDHGIRVILRYYTLATDRQRISSEIVRAVFREFKANPRVEFCYPHTEVLHRPKGDGQIWYGGNRMEAKGMLCEERRPWGGFRVLEEGPAYKVKVIWVNPRARLSYQKHSRRWEHWVIVEGRAKVTLDGKELVLDRGESVDVLLGVAHRIENVGEGVLKFIEVQRGDYLGEDDIVRLEDDYGRVDHVPGVSAHEG